MPPHSDRRPLDWRWITAGILLNVGLLAAMIGIIDPTLARPGVGILIGTVSLALTAIVMGRASAGETVVETGVTGAVVVLLVLAYLGATLDLSVPAIAWVIAPLYAATLAMVSGWTGEMLQGTVADAHDDRALDWPWVFVSVVCGFVLESYALFLGEALLGAGTIGLLPTLFLSVFLTGGLVGFFSPGFTAIEPALASLVLIVLTAGIADVLLHDPMTLTGLLAATVGGLVFGLAGGWLGEVVQARGGGAQLRRLVRGV